MHSAVKNKQAEHETKEKNSLKCINNTDKFQK